uniref:Uncharacterized protein n=1 Tax=Davidia involucrata TaxID=16924 RepID=A0A5B7BSS3_DAVIN
MAMDYDLMQQTSDAQRYGVPRYSLLDWTKIVLEKDHYDRYDTTEDINRRVKIAVPYFEGRDDPTIFYDWVIAIEEYFDWYDVTEDWKVRFAKLKLVQMAKLWWFHIEGDIRRLGSHQ